jgi:hypothetical protein
VLATATYWGTGSMEVPGGVPAQKQCSSARLLSGSSSVLSSLHPLLKLLSLTPVCILSPVTYDFSSRNIEVNSKRQERNEKADEDDTCKNRKSHYVKYKLKLRHNEDIKKLTPFLI